MKTTKQPQHCAHVAAYYADIVDMLSAPRAYSYLNQFLTDTHKIAIGGAAQLVEGMRYALKNAKLAAREWIRAGGAA